MNKPGLTIGLFLVILLAACTFEKHFDRSVYWPCHEGSQCPDDCTCVSDQVCAPDIEGMLPGACAWCPPGRADCNGSVSDGCETRTAADPDHCGACGHSCSTDLVCEYGACMESCRPGLTQCGRSCIDLTSDPLHCAKCDNPCGPSLFCVSGECLARCPEGTIDCNGTCVDPRTDPAHCGGCGELCRLPNARAGCEDARCTVVNCVGEFDDCDGQVDNGCEADLRFDPAHCGDCQTNCGPNGKCINQECDCEAEFANCNTLLSDGCEVNLRNDADHCGDCLNVCNQFPPPTCINAGTLQRPNGTRWCNLSECGYGLEDVTCENGCGMNQCLGVMCGSLLCDPEEWCREEEECRCGPAPGEVCEDDETCCDERCVNTDVNPAHCNLCFNNCGDNAECLNGACTCLEPFENCDGIWADNGCEANTNIDPENCSACNTFCPDNTHCDQSDCYCDDEWNDCNDNWSDGCEADTLTDLYHCGDCDSPCGPEAYCFDGDCFCDPGFGDCNNDWSDGCEIDLSSNPNHCDTCENNCGIGMCCEFSCEDTVNSTEHCGGCWITCGENLPCNGGSCGQEGVPCGIDGDVICNTADGKVCCLLGASSFCEDGPSCNDNTVYCNELDDCGDAEICCYRGTPEILAECSMVSCPGHTLCVTDEQCAQLDPGHPFCCQDNPAGYTINVCSNLACD